MYREQRSGVEEDLKSGTAAVFGVVARRRWKLGIDMGR